jgi:hypothetical protein
MVVVNGRTGNRVNLAVEHEQWLVFFEVNILTNGTAVAVSTVLPGPTFSEAAGRL